MKFEISVRRHPDICFSVELEDEEAANLVCDDLEASDEHNYKYVYNSEPSKASLQDDRSNYYARNGYPITDARARN